jgi:hypothetical protein
MREGAMATRTREEPAIMEGGLVELASQAHAEQACEPQLGPQMRKVEIAAHALWPDGRIPPLLGPREQVRRVKEWLLANDLREDELPSELTIRRYLRTYMRRS